MGDFLGYVRVKVDRSKPLSETPEVYLDREQAYREADGVIEPPGTICRLFLAGGEFVLVGSGGVEMAFVEVSECVSV